MKPNKILITTIISAGLVNAAPALASQYIFTDLGTLGGSSSYATGISNNGKVVGYVASFDEPSWSYRYRAFLYDNGGMQDLGTMGGRDSYATGINDSGQLIGEVYTAGDNANHAFLYVGGSKQYLGTLGGHNSVAHAINSSGQVVGTAETKNSTHAFLYSNGSMQDLGVLGGGFSGASGINDSGQVVVNAPGIGNSYHAFLYRNGSTQDLGTLGGIYNTAYGINNSGQVVGGSTSAVGSYHPYLYSNGSMQDLGTLGGDYGEAKDINNSGQVVGYSHIPNNWMYSHAFLYDSGHMIDLNSRLDAIARSEGWILVDATAINDNGWIVGNAQNYKTGAFDAYLLAVAVPEPDTYAMLLAGLGLIGFTVRRKQNKHTCFRYH